MSVGVDTIEEIMKFNLENTPIIEYLKDKLSKDMIEKWAYMAKPYRGCFINYIRDNTNGKNRLKKDENIHGFYNFVKKHSETITRIDDFRKVLLSTDDFEMCIISGLRYFQKKYTNIANFNTVRWKVIKRLFEKNN